MNNSFVIPKKEYKTSIRQVNLGGIAIGGENSLPFLHSETNTKTKPVIAVEILTNIPENYPETLKKAWRNCINDPVVWAKSAIENGAEVIAVRFNIAHCENIDQAIEKSRETLEKILAGIEIPLIILGSDRKEIDSKLLPVLAKTAGKKCTIGIVTEDIYKEVIPAIKEQGHNVIQRTPIDINLAKQLNILIAETGFDPDKIIVDPNMGALGYGLDYGYSVIERTKLAALEGDDMLNMPVIAFAGEESWKSKEAKAKNAPPEWGILEDRAIMWECVTATSVLAAGADIVVMQHPESVKYIRTFINALS